MDHKLAKKRKDVLATVSDQLLHVTALTTRKNENQLLALKEVSTKTYLISLARLRKVQHLAVIGQELIGLNLQLLR